MQLNFSAVAMALAVSSPVAADATKTSTTGRINAVLDTKATIQSAAAVGRTDTTSGVVFKPYAGLLDGDSVLFEGLPLASVYCLEFRTAEGVVRGWDATVPASDYEQEQALADASRRTILKKLASGSATRFDDRVVVLDMRGNIQNAALLLTKLRTRPFVSGGYKPGEWVWRVERRLWENPDEDTWVPNQDLPYYALTRRRLLRGQFEALRITYARHLGGIRLSERRPSVDLGTIVVPKSTPGIAAVNPDGTPTRPYMIKPRLDPRITDEGSGDNRKGDRP